MHFTKLFKHLGSMITPDLKSDTDVDTRIKKAAHAFGALRSVACDRHLATKIRGMCHEVLIVTVLLHGAESWFLTEAHMQALTAFHRRCVRATCNVNLRYTRKFKIKTATLEEKIGVEPIKMSYHRRLSDVSAIGLAGCGLVASVGPVRVTGACSPSVHALPVDFGVDVRGGKCMHSVLDSTSTVPAWAVIIRPNLFMCAMM